MVLQVMRMEVLVQAHLCLFGWTENVVILFLRVALCYRGNHGPGQGGGKLIPVWRKKRKGLS